MTSRKQTKGSCAYCGHLLTRTGMGRHLDACPERAELIAGRQGSNRGGTFLHLQVKDDYGGDYWLHLEMAASAPIEALDNYLRAIWLECCGHLSRFFIGRRWTGQEIAMSVSAGQVLRPGVTLSHVYDFGTESWTAIRAAGVRQGPATSDRPLVLMARNQAPEFECQECHALAHWLCMECVYSDLTGMLCEGHRTEHRHDESQLFPVVNSPRMGLCGYEGPATAPY